MSEQTANLCTTEACESLRARLAKYEDAEGRPLRIGLRYTSDGELAECPCCGSLDVGGAHDTVNCYSCGLQITKPRPLQNAADAWNKRATLKAQPSGVVLSERSLLSKAAAQIEYLAECLENVTEDDPEDGTAESLDEAREIAEQITARLNSSPVSAGEPVYQFQFREIGEGGWSACDHDWYMHCQKIPERDTRVVQVGVSAGGVDDRAALATHPAGQVAEPTMAMVQAACAAFRQDVSPMEAMHAALCAALLAKP